MRFLVLVLVLMVVASIVATSRTGIPMVEGHEQKRQLDVDDQGEGGGSVNSGEYNKTSGENHHTIPRKDFGKYIGNNDNNGNGSG